MPYNSHTFKPEEITPLYNDEWIYDGLCKHQVNYSMVIHFETDDPVRLKQLKNFFQGTLSTEYKIYENHNVYIYNPWNGLGKLSRMTGEVDFEIAGGKGKFSEEVGGRKRELPESLRLMDEKLKKEKTIFILHNVGPSTMGPGENSHLISALKEWAISLDLIQQRSVVILIGCPLSGLLDEETKNLFATVEIEPGEDTEYKNLISYLANLYGLSLDEDRMEMITKAVRGLNLHQAEALLRESYALKKQFDLEQIKLSKGDLVKKTGILEIEEPKEEFAGIGGYGNVKEFIERKIIDVIYHPERAKKFAVPLPRGILFFGPPGTGKTLFAKALARSIKLPFINLKTENIYSKWLGESGEKMRNAIRMAEKMSPAIVFIDEVDRFGKRRATSDSAGEETRRVFSQLLEWLGDQNRKAIIVGTTNRPDDLDEAFLRTGRFDYKIPILYPDERARLDILCIHLGLFSSPKPKPPLGVSEEQFIDFLRNKIVPQTENFTGADLEELVNRAKRNAFERKAEAIEFADFLESLASFRIDPNSRNRQKEEYEELARKYTDDETFLKHSKIISKCREI